MASSFTFVPFDTLLDLLVPVSAEPDYEIFTYSDYEKCNYLAYFSVSLD